MNDRMQRLRELRLVFEQSRTRPYAAENADLETGPLTPSATTEPVKEGFEEGQYEEFYSIVSQVKLNTHKLKQNTRKVKQIGEQFMESLQDPELKEQREKALQAEKEAAASITQNTGQLFQRLKALEEASANATDTNDPKGLESGYRMIVTAAGSARQNWKEATMGYIDTEKKISTELRERMRRHLRIAEGDDPSEERLDELDDQATDVFAQAMMGKADRQLAMDANDYAHQKEAQVELILASQNEILELWAQLGIVMEEQHQALNNIYENVEKAKEYVKEGNDQLKVVPGMNQQKQRCMCWIMIGLLIILIIVAMPLIVTQS